MVEFLCKVYRSFVNVFSVIALIIMPIVGFVLFGKTFGWEDFNFGMALLGAIIGFVGCYYFELITIPPLMILFSIDSRLERLEEQVFNISKKDSKLEEKESVNTTNATDNINQSNVWVCTKCGETNPVGTMLCRRCNG